MYGLLHPEIEIVGIVTGYGNVTQEQATSNAAYLMQLAGREDIPIINGAKMPLSGEFTTYYPEIHGAEGLGPIRPPKTIQPNIKSFCAIFDIIQRYKKKSLLWIQGDNKFSNGVYIRKRYNAKCKRILLYGRCFPYSRECYPCSGGEFSW